VISTTAIFLCMIQFQPVLADAHACSLPSLEGPGPVGEVRDSRSPG
jgi:hypothetical protein